MSLPPRGRGTKLLQPTSPQPNNLYNYLAPASSTPVSPKDKMQRLVKRPHSPKTPPNIPAPEAPTTKSSQSPPVSPAPPKLLPKSKPKKKTPLPDKIMEPALLPMLPKDPKEPPRLEKFLFGERSMFMDSPFIWRPDETLFDREFYFDFMMKKIKKSRISEEEDVSLGSVLEINLETEKRKNDKEVASKFFPPDITDDPVFMEEVPKSFGMTQQMISEAIENAQINNAQQDARANVSDEEKKEKEEKQGQKEEKQEQKEEKQEQKEEKKEGKKKTESKSSQPRQKEDEEKKKKRRKKR